MTKALAQRRFCRKAFRVSPVPTGSEAVFLEDHQRRSRRAPMLSGRESAFRRLERGGFARPIRLRGKVRPDGSCRLRRNHGADGETNRQHLMPTILVGRSWESQTRKRLSPTRLVETTQDNLSKRTEWAPKKVLARWRKRKEEKRIEPKSKLFWKDQSCENEQVCRCRSTDSRQSRRCVFTSGRCGTSGQSRLPSRMVAGGLGSDDGVDLQLQHCRRGPGRPSMEPRKRKSVRRILESRVLSCAVRGVGAQLGPGGPNAGLRQSGSFQSGR